MLNQAKNEKLVVIYDTYCGWCYGAAPVFDAIVDSDTNVEVIHRHLFQGESTHRMNQGKGESILNTIPTIESLTGQIFTEEFKTNIAKSDTEVLRSSLSAQAAALVHDQGPKKEFAVRKRLEDLHFKKGVSSNDRHAVVDALIQEGIPREKAELIDTPELKAKAAEQSERAKQLMAAVNSRGVPTVLRIKDDDVTRLDHQLFYGQANKVKEELNAL